VAGDGGIGSVGWALPYTQVVVRRLEANGRLGSACATDEVGVITVQGPHVSPGYRNPEHKAGVFNGGVAAYSLGQYLQRFRMLQPVIRPQLVLVAVSTATDLFDLLPPRLGGFVYGGDAARVYFDLDDKGQLVERTFVPQPASIAAAAPKRATGLRLRESLRHLALYRRFQTSLIAMRLATAIRLPGSDPIWAGPEVVLHRELNAREQFQWALATAIIRRLVQEVRASGGTVALVVIPYLPEVYDDIWNATFGRSPAYDRFIGARRLETIAADAGAGFIDTTPALVVEVRRSHQSPHYRNDVIQPRRPTCDRRRGGGFIRADYGRFLTTSEAGAPLGARTSRTSSQHRPSPTN
jgi:hypothetical protein